MVQFSRVAKPVLGKGLGHLMRNGTDSGESAPESRSEVLPDQPVVGQGVGGLLRGPKTAPTVTNGWVENWTAVRFLLWLGDVLLLSLSVLLAVHSRTFGWLDVVFCVLAVLAGAALAIVASLPFPGLNQEPDE